MKRLSHRVAARADLIDIWDYTLEHWGQTQADRYLTLIDDAANSLAAGKLRGSPSQTGYRKQAVGAHIIFYRENEDEITIMRVLHQKMDARRHLPD